MKSLPRVEQYLERLGIGRDTVTLYLELASLPNPSVLQLAKSLGISRTQVYRQLEVLRNYNLIDSRKLSHGTQYHALSLDNIESVLEDRQAELGQAKRDLDTMAQLVREFVAQEDNKSIIRHYYGLNGLKQANWNLTKADGEYRVFEAASLMHHFRSDPAFVRRCNERMAERKLISYDLTNIRNPNLTEMVPLDVRLAHYRYIDPAILSINFEVYLYNDTVTLLDYEPAVMNAVEINHPVLFKMMRQLYDIAWNMATPIELI